MSMLTPGQTLIARASELGSTATTVRGAKQFWMKQLPQIRRQAASRFGSARYSRRASYTVRPALGAPIFVSAREAYRMEIRASRIACALNLQYLDQFLAGEAARLEPICAAAAADLTSNWPYRRSQSRWAGGDLRIYVSVIDLTPLRLYQSASNPSAVASSERVWSRNGKWSGTDTVVRICTNERTLRAFPSLCTADGMVVIDAEEIEPRVFRATWLEQSRGVEVRTVHGWIVRGYHATGTLDQAKRKAAAARRKAAAATLLDRANRKAKLSKLRGLRAVFVDFSDSVAAGNCEAGTRTYANQVWSRIGAVGPCAVRADVVLADRDDSFTRRAVAVAQGRGRA